MAHQIAIKDKQFSYAFLLLGVLSFLLLIAGSYVNSNFARGSVPDWPLSYGRLLLTSLPGNTVYEQVHRWLAAAVLLTTIFVFFNLRSFSEQDRPLIKFAALILVVQILLGGVVVIFPSTQFLSAIHVLTAMLFFSLAVALLAPFRQESIVPKLRRRIKIVTLLLVLQTTLGAFSRHPSNKKLFIVTLLTHLVIALLLFVLIPLTTFLAYRHKQLKKETLMLLLFFILQLFFGVVVFLLAPEPFSLNRTVTRFYPEAHAGHVATDALLLGTCVFLNAKMSRDPRESTTIRAAS